MRRRIGAWRQPENGMKMRVMDELEAVWEAVYCVSISQKFMNQKFCVVITLKKNMKKE